MAEATLNLQPLFCGCSYDYQFTFTEDGAPLDLSSYTAQMDIRAHPADATPLLTCTTENGRLTIDDNVLTLAISAADTAALDAANDGFYDVVLRTGDRAWCPFGGKLPIIAPVTRGTL